MKDILNDAGIFYNDMIEQGFEWLTFWGLEDYHISIPLQKAMDIKGDCIIAHSMNNEPIPRDHGAPIRYIFVYILENSIITYKLCIIRGIIPGFVGARSVKWVDRIVLMKNEVFGMHQTGIAYKQLPPNYKKLSKALKPMIEEAPPIDIIPVTSAVTAPDHKSVVLRGQSNTIRGYAYSGILVLKLPSEIFGKIRNNYNWTLCI